jgi:hypothetical protein
MYELMSNGILDVATPWYAGPWKWAATRDDVKLFKVICIETIPSTVYEMKAVAVPLVGVATGGFSNILSNIDYIRQKMSITFNEVYIINRR